MGHLGRFILSQFHSKSWLISDGTFYNHSCWLGNTLNVKTSSGSLRLKSSVHLSALMNVFSLLAEVLSENSRQQMQKMMNFNYIFYRKFEIHHYFKGSCQKNIGRNQLQLNLLFFPENLKNLINQSTFIIIFFPPLLHGWYCNHLC